jgi:hypothetical protein
MKYMGKVCETFEDGHQRRRRNRLTKEQARAAFESLIDEGKEIEMSQVAMQRGNTLKDVLKARRSTIVELDPLYDRLGFKNGDEVVVTKMGNGFHLVKKAPTTTSNSNATQTTIPITSSMDVPLEDGLILTVKLTEED